MTDALVDELAKEITRLRLAMLGQQFRVEWMAIVRGEVEALRKRVEALEAK